MITPFDSCGDKNPRHLISIKTWITFYLSISLMQVLKDLFIKKVTDWHSNGTITYN